MARLLIILLLFIAQATLAQGQPYVTHLSKDSLASHYAFEENWLYHAGDDTAWAATNYNDSNWIALDSRLRLQDSANKYFKGIGWFRLHLHIDSSLANTPLLLRVEHLGASAIYLDGERIMQYGTIGTTEKTTKNNNPNNFPLAIKSLSPGHHLLAVRYANYYAEEEWDGYNEIEAGFSINLYQANHFFDEYLPEMAFLSIALLTLTGFFLALCLSHLFLWMYQRNNVSNLYFSIFCFGVSLAFFLPYLSFMMHDPEWAKISTYIGLFITVIISCSFSGVSNELFGKSRRRFFIIAAICFVPVIIAFIDISTAVYTILVTLLVVTIESIILTIRAMYRKQPGARIVGAGILFLALFVFMIIAVSLLNRGIRVNGGVLGLLLLFTSVAAILSIPVSMSIYLAWHVARITKDLKLQLSQVQVLNDKTMAQEQEKQRYLETEKERLEEEVTMRTAEIVSEKQKSDDLLRNILPEEVANELKQKGSSEAKYFDHVTVIFTDFVDFTKAGERLTPQQLVDELHTCFKAFDDIASKYNIEKIKTIGDAYLAVSGLPAADHNHAENTVRAALDIKAFMNERKKRLPATTFDIRIGLHSGAVVAGIVGVKKFAYDIWGDTVNTAARMEQSSLPDKINISQTTYELIKDKFICTYRGEIAAKNKGDMNMYFVEGEKEGV